MVAVYPKWKQALFQEAQANKSLDQTTAQDGVYCALVFNTYTYNTAHQFYTDLGANVAASLQITSPTVAQALIPTGVPPTTLAPVFDGNDCTFISVTGGTINALALYRHNSGANSTWRLVFFYDNTGYGLPVTPAGGNVIVSWNPSGIFQI